MSQNSSILLINSYFPYDKQEQLDNAGINDLAETLGVISNIIRNSECDSVVWAGDINTDFSSNTAHCTIVKDSVEEMQVKTVWERFTVDFTCTYERDGITRTSILDLLHISEALLQTVTDGGPIHHPDNTSDHEPIYCIFESITLARNSSQRLEYRPRPSWRMAGQEEKQNYRYMLNMELGAISIPTQLSECHDPHCNDEEHLEAIDWFSAETMEAIQRAGEITLPLPKVGNTGKKPSPGFSERVRPFKETSYFWHSVWKSAGRLLNNQLHQIMKKTRNRYHLEFKKCQKAK